MISLKEYNIRNNLYFYLIILFIFDTFQAHQLSIYYIFTLYALTILLKFTNIILYHRQSRQHFGAGAFILCTIYIYYKNTQFKRIRHWNNWQISSIFTDGSNRKSDLSCSKIVFSELSLKSNNKTLSLYSSTFQTKVTASTYKC